MKTQMWYFTWLAYTASNTVDAIPAVGSTLGRTGPYRPAPIGKWSCPIGAVGAAVWRRWAQL